MITREQLVETARKSAASNAARPLTRAMVSAIGADLEAGEPAWWRTVAPYWSERRFADADQALLLIWTAMHFEAMGGHPLSAMLPTCRGTPTEAGLAAAVRAFLAAPPAGFLQSLAGRRARIYSQFWSARWLEPARLFFQRREMPFYLLEVDSVGGLGAAADLLTPAAGFDSALLEARLALGSPLLDLRKDDDARWLVAACLPDEARDVRAAARSCRLLREALAKDPMAVQFAECPSPTAPAFGVKNVPPTEDAGLLLFTCGLFQELAPDQRGPFAAGAAQLLGRWGDRGLWVAAERSPKDPRFVDAFAYRVRDGKLAPHVLETWRLGGAQPRSRSDAQANAAFLS